MATITQTKINSTSKKNKGQYVVRFRIYFDKDNIQFKTSSDVMFWRRADTLEKKKQNEKSTEIIKQRENALKDKYNTAIFNSVLINGENTQFFEHFDSVMKTRGATNTNTLNGYDSLKKMLQKFCSLNNIPLNIKLNQINKKFVIDFKTWIITEAKTTSGQSFKSSTQNQRFNQFAVVLNDAVDNELIASAPSKGVKAPDKGKEEMVYLTLDEIYQMRDWEKRDTVKPMLYKGFLFACFTGLRGGDISTLKWKHIVEENGITMINLITKKKKIQIRFKLPQQAIDALPERKSKDDNVFTNLRYTAHTNQQLKMWALQCGILKKITSHTARHSFAVHQLKNGTTMYHLSKLLGHSSSVTTERHYADYATEDLDIIIDNVYGNK
ncbi:MAG: tyrosine-type recombinase/integrase [Flavobacteriaceae bacterium]|nr:tyrosine-type recombinase/integrase [Flavobacteriaceae bacterium]MDG1091526.1 tyrosine-type recombinase/integrase [Flavobacteriaceae bacterium]